MTKYQSAVIWLGLALIVLRYLTTGQRSLFHNLLTSGGNSLNTNPLAGGIASPQGLQAISNPGQFIHPGAPTATPKPATTGPSINTTSVTLV